MFDHNFFNELTGEQEAVLKDLTSAFASKFFTKANQEMLKRVRDGESYHLKTSGEFALVSPKNGESFELGEICNTIGCNFIEVVYLTDDLILIIDEEGKLSNEVEMNVVATAHYLKNSLGFSDEAIKEVFFGKDSDSEPVDFIAGDCIICHTEKLA